MRPGLMSANTVGVMETDGPQSDFWIPALKKMQAFGPVYQNKFEWPSITQLNKFDLTRQISLCGIELAAS